MTFGHHQLNNNISASVGYRGHQLYFFFGGAQFTNWIHIIIVVAAVEMKIVKTSPFAVEYKFRLGLSTSGRTLNRKKRGMILESLLPKCIACVCVCVLRCTFIERLILLLFLLLLFSILPCLAPPWRCHCEAGCHGDAEFWRQNTLQCQTIHERAKKGK